MAKVLNVTSSEPIPTELKKNPYVLKKFDGSKDDSKSDVSNTVKSDKSIAMLNFSSDFQGLERNNLLRAIYEIRLDIIKKLENVEIGSTEMNEILKESTRRLLSSALTPLQQGVAPEIIVSALTPELIASVVVSDIYSKMSISVYDKLKPIVKTLCGENDDIRIYHDACKNLKTSDRLPFNPETAAQVDIARGIRYYKEIRQSGLSDDDKNRITEEYNADKRVLRCYFSEDCVDTDNLRLQNHDIVITLVKTDATYRRMFDSIYKSHGVNLDKIERSFAQYTNSNGKQISVPVYRIPIGGLVYTDDGTLFLHEFAPRPFYTSSVFSDAIYDLMKKHYGRASRAYKSGDKAYLSDETYRKDLSMAYEIRSIAIEDGMTKAEFDELLKYVTERCEMYYHTEDVEGVEEWSKAHPDEAKLMFDSEIELIEAPVKKKHIKINQKRDEDVEWVFVPTSDKYVSAFSIQPSLYIKKSFEKTMSESDYDSMATLMHDLSAKLDSPDDAYKVEQTVKDLMDEPEKTVKTFLSKYGSKKLSEDCKFCYDLIKAMFETDAPVIDSHNRLVATRNLHGIINVGDIGGKIVGESVVEGGCWIDSKSVIRDSELRGNVFVLLRSTIRNSKIKGAGLIVNTDIAKSNLNGQFNEYDLRTFLKARHKSPIYHIEITDLNAEIKAVGSAGTVRIKTHTNQYINRTVEEYVLMWMKKNHKTRGLAKMTDEQMKARDDKRTEDTQSFSLSKNSKALVNAVADEERELISIENSLSKDVNKILTTGKDLKKL